ncbi:hypothetical protein [Microbulbifer variabilis]|uniref:hypothetical protein n=1 Tax=Microbulbifer variabilis TaxID=266805 RepID=UPI001CFE4481|nr:hypothetical protein [Microbulbifer variabilis]
MKNITITLLYKINSPKGIRYPTTWPEFVEEILNNGHKIASKKNIGTLLFSMAEFKGGRRAKFIKKIYGMILDIDGSSSVSAVREKLGDFEYIMYSTFSHRKRKGVEKFKVVLIFNEPYNPSDMSKRVNVLKKIFYYCDPSSFNLTQFQALPNCPRSRQKLAFIEYNPGHPFNLSKLPIDKFLPQTEKKLASIKI